MAVPAHDSRDFEFATAFDLPIRCVVAQGDDEALNGGSAYTGSGIMINSSPGSSGVELNGLSNTKAAAKVTEWLELTGQGKRQVLLLCLFCFCY